MAYDQITLGTSWIDTSDPKWGLVSDTNLSLGSAINGSDQTAKVQAVLNAAAGGNAAVYWSGAYSVGNVFIRNAANLNIQFANKGCGLGRASGGVGPLLSLGTPILGLQSGTPVTPGVGKQGNATLGGFAHTNIRLAGGTINWMQGPHLAQPLPFSNSTVGPNNALQFWGVDGLVLDDVDVFDQGNYGIHFSNARRVRITGGSSRIPDANANFFPDGRDALHCSNVDNVIIRGRTIYSADDSFGMNANDGSTTSLPCPFTFYGPITRVKFIDNILDGSNSGIRILTSDQLIDDILIRGTTGSTRNSTINMDNGNGSGATQDPAGLFNPNPGFGNIGSMTIEDHDVQQFGPGASNPTSNNLGPIFLGCNFDSIRFQGKYRPYSGLNQPFIHIWDGVTFNRFHYDIDCTDINDGTTGRVLVMNRAGTGIVTGSSRLARPSLAVTPFPAYQSQGASVTSLNWSGSHDGAPCIVDMSPGGSATNVVLAGEQTNYGSSGAAAVNLGSSGQPVTNLNVAGLITPAATTGSATVPTYVGQASTSTPTPPVQPDSRVSGLLASYHFDDADGTTLKDYSAAGRTGTGTGTVTHGTPGLPSGPAWTKYAEGDGTHYYTLPNADGAFTAAANHPLTFLLWFQLANVTTAQILWGEYDGTQNNVPNGIVYVNNGTLTVQFGRDGQTGTVTLPNIVAGTTYMLIADFDGASTPTVTAQLNNAGTKATFTGAVNTVNPEAFAIGNVTYSGNSDPLLAGAKYGPFRAWDRLLTTAERASEYNSGAGSTYAGA